MKTTHALPVTEVRELDARGVRTLARSVYRSMQTHGYSEEHMVDFATTMLDLVREQMSVGSRR